MQQRAVELAVDDAETRRRNAHARRGVADAQVAGERERAAAAHAVARDRGDGGLAAVAQRDRRRLVRRLVDASRLGIGTHGRELGDVGAGAEMPARAGQDHDAHVLAAAELARRSRASRRHMASDTALRLPGRFSVTVATPLSSAETTISCAVSTTRPLTETSCMTRGKWAQ